MYDRKQAPTNEEGKGDERKGTGRNGGVNGEGRGEEHKSTEEKASVTRKQGPTK